MNKRKFFLLPICLLLLGACNAQPSESTPSKTEEVCEHEFGDWSINVRPTCVKDGSQKRTCTKCGYEETQKIDALGHTWDEGEMTTRPTADAAGEMTYHCTVDGCDGVKTEVIEKVTGYTVTFNQGEHFKVYVYRTQAYDTETPTEAYSVYARDKYGNAVEYDPADTLDQPQVNFKVVCDEGYSVGINDVKVVGADGTTNKDNLYKNFKQGENAAEGLPDAEHYRITKIQRSLTITITPIEGEQQIPEVTFIKNHCSVVVYKSSTISDENIDTSEHYYSRDKTSGEIVKTGGQIYFKVVPETGYVWNHGLTGEVKVNTIPFIAQKSENSGKNLKVLDGGVYNITQLNDSLSILINCTPEGGEEGLGYTVTFVTGEHCKVLVYQTQDYQFTPVAPVDNKALTRTSKGDAAKYVADNPDTTDVDEEIKPQVNFKIVCDEGYTVAVGNISISGTKGTEWNKLESPQAGVFKITKIKADLTVTISAVAVAE